MTLDSNLPPHFTGSQQLQLAAQGQLRQLSRCVSPSASETGTDTADLSVGLAGTTHVDISGQDEGHSVLQDEIPIMQHMQQEGAEPLINEDVGHLLGYVQLEQAEEEEDSDSMHLAEGSTNSSAGEGNDGAVVGGTAGMSEVQLVQLLGREVRVEGEGGGVDLMHAFMEMDLALAMDAGEQEGGMVGLGLQQFLAAEGGADEVEDGGQGAQLLNVRESAPGSPRQEAEWSDVSEDDHGLEDGGAALTQREDADMPGGGHPGEDTLRSAAGLLLSLQAGEAGQTEEATDEEGSEEGSKEIIEEGEGVLEHGDLSSQVQVMQSDTVEQLQQQQFAARGEVVAGSAFASGDALYTAATADGDSTLDTTTTANLPPGDDGSLVTYLGWLASQHTDGQVGLAL